KPRILVLCTGNSARSQMAEGLLKRRVGDRFQIDSAGTQPSIVRPEAIAVLAEIGINISENRSKSVDEFADAEIDFVLTVCDNAKENCPYFPARTKFVHHAFEDPAETEGDLEERFNSFKKVRDQIADYIDGEFAEVLDGK
ncbi:MAG TPA: arsenate reductase ArsC, partial [Pyrinomonadaceae bacterium]|nr:arsenate reductase ArsC [Pyrinomonadaceae bacterium]